MKILMVAPIHKEKEYLRQKNKLPFLYGQGQQGWYDAFIELGHKVFVFRYSDSYLIPNKLRIHISSFFNNCFPVWKSRFNRYSNKINLFLFEDLVKNNIFRKYVDQIKPDLILVSGGLHGIFPETLKDVKNKHNSKTILLSGVNPNYGASDYDKKLIRDDFFDAIFINDKGYGENWKKLGAKKIVVLPISSADLRVHKKVLLSSKEKKEYKTDVCFIGTLSYYRQKILLNLIEFDLKIWGDVPPGVKLQSRLKLHYFGKAEGEKMVKIYNASKIVLNIHAEDMKYGGNMKTFEIPACGTFQMIDNIDSSWFTDEKEIVIYNSLEDLKKKIEYYLKHEDERNRIAKAGFYRASNYHSYKEHFKEIFNVLYNEDK